MHDGVLSHYNDSCIDFILKRLKRAYPSIKFLAKGWRSWVFEVNGKVIKVCKRKDVFNRELKNLITLQRFPFVPKIYGYIKSMNAIIMEKIKGESLENFLLKEKDQKRIRMVVRECLLISLCLDWINFFSPEFNKPYKHLIVTKKGVKLIDFERFRKSRRSNFTQLISYFFFNKKISSVIKKAFSIKRDIKRELLLFCKEYKRKRESNVISSFLF